MALVNHARPITEVLKDEKVPPRIRKLLAEIDAIKRFGEENGLKATQNYQDYVQLDRSAAVYVVSACEPLQFKSKEWKFPIVGSFPYLGWFHLDDAKEYAEDLRKEGWDVDVRGARAFSTLGWFRDSILSSMIDEGAEALGELVNVVLHESVHATLYINGQSYFDESVASFIADRLTPAYLEKTRGKTSTELKSYFDAEESSAKLRKRLHEAYEALEKIYVSESPNDEKLKLKADYLARLKEELKFKRPINNATLIQYKTYNTGGAEFDGLFQTCGQDWRRFLASLLTLKSRDFQKSQQDDLGAVLSGLALKGCPAPAARD